MKAIRRKCMECCCGQRTEVERCHIKDCALWAFRFGKIPEEYPTYEVEVSEAQIESGKRMSRNITCEDGSEALDTETTVCD